MIEFEFEEIEFCECIGDFEDDYVYDIEVDDDTHTFIANDILVHNSLYISYENLIKSIDGYDKLSNKKLCEILVDINNLLLNDHNKQFMDEYYTKRYAKSIHEFELETVALAGVWLNVKKRYAQILLWKDGKFYDEDDLPMKIKGLEVVKSSVPKLGRSSLKELIRYLIINGNDKYIVHKLNMKVQEERQKFNSADIEDICGSSQVNNYYKYIEDDEDLNGLKVGLKCPYNVRAVGNYNWIRNRYKLEGEPIHDGKVKYYIYNIPNSNRTDYFAFQGRKYPSWADKYAPINRKMMFEKFVLDSFNRILEAININKLNVDGSIQTFLF